uniref:Caerulein-3.2/3.2Y4 n=1 Tax=Ranoidea citropa TaxID=94770 RepID=CAE32_RANCI|nr:RecName: Full=Caerulein-3.2/3.2Y4 [Ranoidea citropa]
QQDYGTGWFDF